MKRTIGWLLLVLACVIGFLTIDAFFFAPRANYSVGLLFMVASAVAAVGAGVGGMMLIRKR